MSKKRNQVPPNRMRINVSVSPEARAAMGEIAKREHRTVSNLLEWLVLREQTRIEPTTEPHPI
jgi:hypothetical protein